jgi:hypothetical protein
MIVQIYTNGKSLFTLADFGKTAGASLANGISKHSQVSKLMSRHMHSIGQLHYISGTADRKVLSNILLNRKMKLSGFQIN